MLVGRTRGQRPAAYRTYLLIEGGLAVLVWMATTINLVYQVEVAHLDALQLVLVGTAMEGTAFFCQVPTGMLADTYSRKLAVVVGVVFLGMGAIIQGLFPLFGTIALASAISSLGYSFMSGAEEAWIADEIGEEHVGAAFLRGAQVGQVGALAGMFAGTALALIRLSLPIVTSGTLMLGLAVYLALTMRERPRAQRTAGGGASWRALGGSLCGTLRESVTQIRGRPLLLLMLAVTAFFGMSSEGFDRLKVAHFLEDYRLPTLGALPPVVWFGIMNAGVLLLGLAGIEIARRRVDMRDPRQLARALCAVNALLVVSIAIFALAGSFALALAAFWGAALVRQMRQPIYLTWLVGSTPAEIRATVVSVSGQLDALGQVVGGPPIGALGTLVSLRAALVATAVALMPALPLFMRAWQGAPRPQAPGSAPPEARPAAVAAREVVDS